MLFIDGHKYNSTFRFNIMKRATWVVWLGVFLILLVGGLLTSIVEQSILSYQGRAQMQSLEVQLQSMVRRLEHDLNNVLALNYVLADEIQADHGHVDTQKMQQIAQSMLVHYEHVASITLSSGFVVDFVYPLQGNEAVLGMNYRFRPDVMAGVQRAIAARDTIVAGPLKLVQNGRLGLIGRTPIFLYAPGEPEYFLGVVSIAVDVQSVLARAGFLDPRLPFRFAIRGYEEQGAEGELFYGHIELFKQAHLSADIRLPGGRWRIAAAPVKPKYASTMAWQWSIRIVGGGFSLSLVWLLLRMRRQAQRRTEFSHLVHGIFSLRVFIMVLLVLLLLPIVLASSYLSYRNALQVAEQYSRQLVTEVGGRVYDRIVSFFDIPRRVLAFNVEQANAGLLNPQDRLQLMRGFLLQMRQQPLLTFISMGMADGEYYAGSRPPLGFDKGLRMLHSRKEDGHSMRIYRVDDANRRGSLVSEGSSFDARTRPWFHTAMKVGSMGWYPVYQYAINDIDSAYATLGMGMSAPLYNDQGDFLGVMTADLALSQLSDFLAELTSANGGIAFIMEPNGELLASSFQEEIYQLRPDYNPIRLKAADSQNPIIQAASRSIQQQTQPDGTLLFEIEGRRYQLDWRHYTLLQGPTLDIAVVLPDASFTGPMRDVLYNSIALALAVLVICMLIGLVVSSWVAKPLAELSHWAEKLADGDWNAVAPKSTPVQEVICLSAALDAMSNQLKQNTLELESRIQQRTADLEAANKRLAELSTTDGLTGLANRRHFDEVVSSEWLRARREDQTLALLMVDVDFFKRYNDCYGHISGDTCLKMLAGVLKNQARRGGDLVARYGGEEFVVILANTNAEGAQKLAEKTRKEVESLDLVHDHSPFGVVTISLGIAVCRPQEGRTEQELLLAADHALYQAKTNGRNRVCLEPC
ncbi:diguanylate cyclase (GGDEF)-like protein [Azomonas agilis]|uniref:diguanylate cyclase n=2 Tax=Azomonas agilis TaxID=116849 RepID=A0A562I1M6_9GAMM|nr:diguanylate cyclase (GGDEF)-like protein [Azomonas agilis]